MKNLFLSLLLLFSFSLQCHAKGREVTVLQWNIWQEGTMIPGGYEAIVNEILRLHPDFVTFSEVRNYNHSKFNERIVESLRAKGLAYHSFYTEDSGLLSKYPIQDSTTIFPLHNDHGSIYRLVANVGNQEFAVYTAHLDYLDDAYYNVRGYDGSTWQKIPIPQTVSEVLVRNEKSQRDDAIKHFLNAARRDVEKGRVVVLGGDFNEPSHLDWTRATKDLYDHHGLIVPWTVPLMLDNAGYVDAYREKYPDVLQYPGFTFPADNPLKAVEKLTWTPDADERDRIDYVFFHPHPRLRLKDAAVFGPRGSIVKSQRIPETSKDKFILPLDVWPTDHKGVWVRFELR